MNKETLVGKRARIKQGSYGRFAAKDYVDCEGTIVADHRHTTAGSWPFPLCLKLRRFFRIHYIGVREEWLEILEK